MTLTYHGVTHDTDAMEEFHTGDHDLPLIYMTRDRELVFILRRNAVGELHALRAADDLIRLAAVGFRLPQLYEALACGPRVPHN
jgi:hypothetical protein